MKISILGCGWLGLPLARHLITRKHHVKGSTTSLKKVPMLRAYGIDPYKIVLDPELKTDDDISDFWDAEALVINIPPGRGRDDIIRHHATQIKSIIQQVQGSPIRHVVFISSTSVYPKRPGVVTEDQAVAGKASRTSGNALLQAEQMLMSNPNFETTVLRFGGLIGGTRHPAKYLSGRKDLDKADAPVNLIHQDDCIQIITQIIEEDIIDEIFNAVADDHPTREEYYKQIAKDLGLEPPTFKPSSSKEIDYKVVSNAKLKNRLGYTFTHSHP